MAAETDKSSIRALADATGIIFDRTVVPEKMIGQAWLVSRTRAVTLASVVANYSEAPWALSVKFPFPDLTLAVRGINLMSEFNKREARNYYLALAHGPGAPPPQMENDIAYITLDSDLTPPAAERVAEINRALTLPLSLGAQDLSGVMHAGDQANVIQSVLATGRPGMLSLIDSRNVPFARLAIRQGKIVKAIYGSLYNERAILELFWKKPAGNFMFQGQDQYSWGDLPDIAMPAGDLVAEISRRIAEMPPVLEALGGLSARFQKLAVQPDLGRISQVNQWIGEWLWNCLDGHATLGQLSERIPADTCQILKTILEMRDAGFVTACQSNPFTGGGQPGFMLPGPDMDLWAWDSLDAFYLEPAGFAPVLVPGNFFGIAHTANPKILLHTANLPAHGHGAAILRDGKLIAVHSGLFGRQPEPLSQSLTLGQMASISCMSEGASTKLKTHMTGDLEAPSPEGPDMTTLRSGGRTRALLEDVDSPFEEESPAAMYLSRFTKLQLAGAAGALAAVSLILMLVLLFSGKPAAQAPGPGTQTAQVPGTPPASQAPTSTAAPATPAPPSSAALNNAKLYVGLPDKLPSTFVVEDTADQTKPKLSLALKSEQQKEKLLFLVWPNTSPMTNLEKLTVVLPVYDYKRVSKDDNLERGTTEKIRWFEGDYHDDKSDPRKNETISVFVASYLCPNDPTMAVLVIATSLDGSKIDHGLVLSVLDELFYRGTTHAAPAATKQDYASDAQVADYRKKIEGLLRAAYKAPKTNDAQSGQVVLDLTLDGAGSVTKMAMRQTAGEELDKAVQKVVTACAPYPPPPPTRDNSVRVLVTADGGKISVQEP